MRTRFPLLVLVAVLLAACDDNFGPGNWDATPDTVALYSLSRPDLLGFPSGYDFSTRRTVEVETPGETGNWDVALAEQNGALQLLPAGAFVGQTSRAGIATIEGQSFDALEEAPRDTAQFTGQPVTLRTGGVYVVRTRRVACGFGTAVHYAKVLAVNVDAATGIARLAIVANPFCNDRSFVPPED